MKLNVVFTSCYSSPHDDSIVATLEHEVTSRGGHFTPVFLECSLAELKRRVVDPARQEVSKLHSVQGLEDYMGAWNFVALDRPNTISISTDARSPEECAQELAERIL